MRTTRRNSAMVAVAMAIGAFATACHSGSSTAAGSPISSHPGSQEPTGSGSLGSGSPGAHGSASGMGAGSAIGAACRTAALTFAVDTRQAGAAGGSSYYPIDFTNKSAAACTLDGYPGVSFVTSAGSAGKQLGAAATENPAFDRARVRLAPGGHAHAWLQVSATGNYAESDCHAVTARALRIYPPGETKAGYVGDELTACTSSTAQLLTVMPVRGGDGSHGNTP